MTIARVFENEPTQWGLRGDPLLWRDMAKTLLAKDAPKNASDFERLLINAFENLTGEALDSEGTLILDKYKSSGMSSGAISFEFWRNKGIPLLVARYAET